MKPLREHITFPLGATVSTPWGEAIGKTVYAPGIVAFITQQHVGFLVSPERIATMPDPLGKLGTFAGPGWYEGGHDWALVAVAFPEAFEDDELFLACEILLGSNRPPYFDGVDAWLATPYAQAIRDRVDAWFKVNGRRLRLADCFEPAGDRRDWKAYASSLDHHSAVVFTMPDYPPTKLGATFTAEDIAAAGGAILRHANKDSYLNMS